MTFEHDGEQHFKFLNWFHKSQEASEKLQADDAKKTLLCEQHGIKLYRVRCENRGTSLVMNWRTSDECATIVVSSTDRATIMSLPSTCDATYIPL